MSEGSLTVHIGIEAFFKNKNPTVIFVPVSVASDEIGVANGVLGEDTECRKCVVHRYCVSTER